MENKKGTLFPAPSAHKDPEARSAHDYQLGGRLGPSVHDGHQLCLHAVTSSPSHGWPVMPFRAGNATSMVQAHSDCPRCGTHVVRLTRPRNAWDHLFTMVYCYPFRCQLCRARYRVIQPRYRFEAERADWREYVRIPVEFRAFFSGEQIRGEGTMVDTSINGCWIKSGIRVPKGAAIRLRVYGVAQEPPIEIEATIAWCRAGRGFGLTFFKMAPEHEAWLRQLITARWTEAHAGQA